MQTSKTTTSKTNYKTTTNAANIQPISGYRNVVITRTGPAISTAGNQNASSIRTIEMKKSYGVSATPGATSNIVHSGVNNLMNGREKEKNELQELNDRFANYIDKVRSLEDENKRLTDELNDLKDQWGKETARIKALYDSDMSQLRRSLDQAEASKAQLEMKINTLEDLIQEAHVELNDATQLHTADKETIDKMTSTLSDYEHEIGNLRKRLSSLEEEKIRDNKEIIRLKEDINQLKKDLDKETLEHITAHNEVQSLLDQIEFLKKIFESEIRELAALVYKDSSETKDFWRNEMAQALRDIQSEYDKKMEALHFDMEAQYTLKIQEVRTNQSKENVETVQLREENTRLKDQLADMRNRLPELEARNNELERLLELLRREIEEKNRDFDMEKANLRKELMNRQSELESILIELQILLDAKLSLELEIIAYRKMLEGEEYRVNRKSNSTFNQTGRNIDSMDHITRSTISQQQAVPSTKTQVTSIVKGEMSAKTSFQRTAKGNVTIQECSADGKFIILENTGSQDEDISGYILSRNTDNGRIIVKHVISPKSILEPTGKNRYYKIWARGNKPQGSNDAECSESNWGYGAHIVTTLQNSKGEEKATHTQRTVYQL
uniref:Intermediate filament b n=1 Tax=Dugesia japonica TaxID=6161 RepID=Q95P01_DUGJA|nr:intermediate filament b [Dugesia japonica]BAB64910.1 intermediate filament b [Dugesia japonica]